MKHSFFIWLSSLWLVPMFVVAQNPESFRQPYPLGGELSEAAAKNFTGKAYIAPITSNKE